MIKEDFANAMYVLNKAYNREMEIETLNIWYEFFKDCDLETFKIVIKKIISTSKYMPSIADVKSEIAFIKVPELRNNWETEFETVKQAVRNFGSYKPIEALSSLNPMTASIVKMIGYTRICMSEDLTWIKKDFKNLFELEQSKQKADSMIEAKYMSPVEILQLKDEQDT